MPLEVQTYHEKTFHRKYMDSFGNLKPSQLPPVDYADKEQLEMLFPAYRREFIALEKAGTASKLTRQVDIECFNLHTPNKSHQIFKNTKLVIEPHKRCAVYGENGSGKTLLFAAIADGSIRHFPKYMSTHHMKEMPHDPLAEDVSVLETVVSADPMRRILVVLEEELTRMIPLEDNEERKAKLESNLKYIQANMTRIDGYTTEERSSKMLRVLGFDEVGEAAPMSSLSGGLRMRVALASAFIINPDLLLLDEPTNHLDLPSVLWLENCLRGYKGSFLLVTHDRNLLENVVTSVYYLQDQQILGLPCGFKEFEKRRTKMDKDKDKMIDKFLDRNRNLDPTSPLYRTKMDYMKWQKKRLARQVLLTGKFTFQSPKPLPSPNGLEQADIPLITAKEVRFSYDEAKGLPFIFDNPFSYTVKQGTRVGVMGPNGAGKSTFLKLITGKIVPTTGSIESNKDYKLAYFGQHSTKELNMDDTPFEFMCAQFPKANEGAIKSHLTKTSVDSGTQNTRMNNLSFSQRSCVIFAKLTFVPPHLLIMDEPTNFLDLDSVDSLIKAANKFSGGLIVVTHNRDFLKRTCKHFLSIVPGAFLEFETMKEAERATYSFISAMERGEDVDAKSAIQANRGGGAVHTEEEQAARQKALTSQQVAEQKRLAAIQAEKDAAEAKAAEKAAKIAARIAAQKLDWVAGDKCWVPTKGKKGEAYSLGTVLRNIPGMGVSVELATGKKMMVEAKKLKVENPTGGGNAEAASKRATQSAKAPAGGGRTGGRGGGRGGARGGGGGGRGGGRGGKQQGGRQQGGGRGGRGGGKARGGGRGGRGGGRSQTQKTGNRAA